MYIRAVKSELIRKHDWPTGKANLWGKENIPYLHYLYNGHEPIETAAFLVDRQEG